MNSNASTPANVHREHPATVASGWLFLFIVIAMFLVGVTLTLSGARFWSGSSIVGGVSPMR